MEPRNRSRTPAALGGALTFALLAACQAERPGLALAAGTPLATDRAKERVAELYVSTEVLGFIEPCGCTARPLGGVQRLATVLSTDKPHALLDAGNLFFPEEPLTETTRDQHVLKARLLSRVYRQLGAAAINLGPSDLAAGPEFLAELQREGAVPILSTNVRPTGDGGPAVAQSFLREIGGIRVGVLGVAAPEHFAGKPQIAVVEYAPALRAEQALLRKRGAELVVALARVGEPAALELARDVPELDLIVRSPGTPITAQPSAPRKVGSVIVLEAGSQGQHVARLTLRFGPSVERPIELDAARQEEVARRTLAERKLRAFRIEADAWQGDPAKAEAVQQKRAQLAALERQLAQPIAPAGPQPLGSVRVELVPLTDEVAPEARASDLMTAYYAQLKGLNAGKGDLALCKLAEGAAGFVGSEACQGCHPEAYAVWKRSKHGDAWATLESQNKQYDLTCVGCHSVGYQRPGGYCRLADVGALTKVGCESCHGPGSVHAKTPTKQNIDRAVTEDTCAKSCHVPEHSDTFLFSAYLPRILGPGHGAPK